MTSRARTAPHRAQPQARGTPPAAATIGRLPRQVWYVVTTVVAVAMIVWPVRHVLTPDFVGYLWARDFVLYRDAAARFMAGGPFYLPEQLVAPYGFFHGVVLYPPPSLLLFAPFVALPAILWWAIPIGITAEVVRRLRPHPATWPVMLVALLWPFTTVKLLAGNPVMWVVAAVALGRLAAWPYLLAALKPSLFPFALLGIRHRSWWIALAATAAACLVLAPVLPSWPDYVRALLNAREQSGLLYSILEIPMVLIPLIAGLGRSGRPTPGEAAEAAT